MNGVTDFMSKDHDRLDSLFKDFQSKKITEPEIAKKSLSSFKSGLERHIVWEEDILFPVFEDKTEMHKEGPTFVMRSEHREIKNFLERIHSKLVKEDINDLSELEKALFKVLSDHNQKEENILYPWIDSSTTVAEREKLFARMKSLPAERYNKCCE